MALDCDIFVRSGLVSKRSPACLPVLIGVAKTESVVPLGPRLARIPTFPIFPIEAGRVRG